MGKWAILVPCPVNWYIVVYLRLLHYWIFIWNIVKFGGYTMSGSWVTDQYVSKNGEKTCFFWCPITSLQKSNMIKIYLKVGGHRWASHMFIICGWNFIIYLFHIKKINLLLTVQIIRRVPSFEVSSTSHLRCKYLM